jgi:hypothetical protein
MSNPPRSRRSSLKVKTMTMKTINLEDGMPLVHQALSQLEGELAGAKRQGHNFVKLVHGYGSTGVGGEIRLAVQRRLREMSDHGQIQGCIFGENWSQSDDAAWKLVKAHPALKQDRDFGRRNLGVTIVLL